jgi:FtsP/CotA-like multicopper oxidase with cupredoxin domain
MKTASRWRWLLAIAAFACVPVHAGAQTVAPDKCPRPTAGSTVAEPQDLRSRNGVLSVELTYHRSADANGGMRYCYISPDGNEAPTLRLKPGDLLILRLKNDVPASPSATAQSSASTPGPRARIAGTDAHRMTVPGECAGVEMSSSATNIHFHGLDLPPVCHQDDVLNTMIEPGSRPFEYRFRIPADEPPGLYWYHPHVHGFTKAQVLGGASGALIVEGIERANPQLAGLPERVFVIRDQDLMNPDARPVPSGNVPPPVAL